MLDKDKIEHKFKKAFELKYGARINEFNQQIFLVESGDWEIKVDKYIENIRSLDWLRETQKAMEAIFDTTISVKALTPTASFEKLSSEMNNVIYDFRGLSEVRDKVSSGDHLCIIDTTNVPKDLICFAGFNSDILVEYELNKFKTYKTGVNTAIAIVKEGLKYTRIGGCARRLSKHLI